ncbi:MAG: hypothetical protein KIH63_000370 [Candidatus Saccharibacteria bacterium]|nr:hypothetical protein [Candidatus Saccharibacteria bacterium]
MAEQPHFRSFAEEIAAHKTAETVSPEVIGLETIHSALDVRLRGAFITRCELTSPTTGQRAPVLFQDHNLSAPKLDAAHAMLPAGKYAGIGEQHGYPRWADYHAFPVVPGYNGRDQLALQAVRSDTGLAFSRIFELGESEVRITNRVQNPGQTAEHTSIGEHLYLDLPGGSFADLLVDGRTIDELAGPGSSDVLHSGGTLFYQFDGQTVLEFPAGHAVRLAAEFTGETAYPPALWIWKKPDHPSICFEPVVGVAGVELTDDRQGVTIQPGGVAELTTTIVML